MYFDIMSKGTIAECAKLEFNKITTTFICRDCNREFPKTDSALICPYCGGKDIRVEKGKEFYIEYIEAE